MKRVSTRRKRVSLSYRMLSCLVGWLVSSNPRICRGGDLNTVELAHQRVIYLLLGNDHRHHTTRLRLLECGYARRSLRSFELWDLSEESRSRNDLPGLLTRLNDAGSSPVSWRWTFGRHSVAEEVADVT